jgi:hypothetical protein
MVSINEVFTTVNANNLKHLDEDSQRNELFLAIPNQDKVALSFYRLLICLHQLVEYNEFFWSPSSPSFWQVDISNDQL